RNSPRRRRRWSPRSEPRSSNPASYRAGDPAPPASECKGPGQGPGPFGGLRRRRRSADGGVLGPALAGLLGALRIAQHVAATPHGLDVVVAAGGGRQLLAQLA